MPATLSIIGLDAREIGPVRRLVSLLRAADPLIAELTRQAITYLEEAHLRGLHDESPNAPGTLPTQSSPTPDWLPAATRRNEIA